MPSNMDDEFGRRDYREESWSNYHEDRQHVSYQFGEESDSTWSKQAHQNEMMSIQSFGLNHINSPHGEGPWERDNIQ